MTNAWNADLYDAKHHYVTDYGASLVQLLAPQPGERILDLGCGTGHLAHQITERGAQVVGLDNSADMIQMAQQNYPDLTFIQGEATAFRFDEPFDAIFSNAALHWIKDAEPVVVSMARALKPGGRLVVEFGSRGNIGTLITGIQNALQAYGYYFLQEPLPWYFPSIGEYARLLEKHGFRVVYATDFDRPTPLEGENALRNWLAMFGGSFFRLIPADQIEPIIQDIETRLRPLLYRDGQWLA
ncbi:MAG TPA: methyltransferase domain-containing protein, partial [Phototrophicaceae bacterium]|nr:methyltransferase domain-containing protein [Phototrophicaceae bacterium]